MLHRDTNVMSGGWRRKARRTLVTGVFWLALVACVFLLFRYFPEASALLGQLGAAGALAVVFLLSISWLALVVAWQLAVLHFAGEPLSAARAARHLSLLLLGKYLPGGVWGFTARLADTPAEHTMAKLAVAGVFEQWAGISTLILMASILWLQANIGQPVVMVLMLVVPYVVITGWRMVVGMCARVRAWLPWGRIRYVEVKSQARARLLGSATFTALHQAAQLSLVAVLSKFGLEMSWPDAWLIASLYGAAISVGMLVIIVPGGIVVREGVFIALVGSVLSPDQALGFSALLRLIFAGFDFCSALAARLLGWRERQSSG